MRDDAIPFIGSSGIAGAAIALPAKMAEAAPIKIELATPRKTPQYRNPDLVFLSDLCEFFAHFAVKGFCS
jgi:hypothetical protein